MRVLGCCENMILLFQTKYLWLHVTCSLRHKESVIFGTPHAYHLSCARFTLVGAIEELRHAKMPF